MELFFAKQSFAGTNEDTSKNRKFTISDGISNVEIVLNYDDINIDGLVDGINYQLGTNFLAKAEKVNDTQFKIASKAGANEITISGVNKGEFF